MKSNDIEQIRAEIDSTDASIVDLIIRRSTLAAKIGEIKHKLSLPVFRPDRHMQVYNRILAVLKSQSAKPGMLPGELRTMRDALVHIYREIMSLGMAVEGRLSVFASTEGARSAAALCFGRSIEARTFELSNLAGIPHDAYIVVPAIPEHLAPMQGSRWRICAGIPEGAEPGPAGFYVLSLLSAERTGNDRTVFLLESTQTDQRAGERLTAGAGRSILDVPGHFQDADVLARIESGFVVLGSYPVVVEL